MRTTIKKEDLTQEELSLYKKLLAEWDGWGDSPLEQIAFQRAMVKTRKLQALMIANAHGWRAIYKEIQGKVQLNCEFLVADKNEAYEMAVKKYGKPDGWNTFIHLQPIVEHSLSSKLRQQVYA